MRKKIGSGLLALIGVVIIILAGLSVYEYTHTLLDYESYVGKNINAPRSQYTVGNRSDHLGYLEIFDFQGQKIRYIDRGDRNGTPLLLVHGTPTNSRLRRKMIPGLIDAGYRVIAPDQYGFGASDKSTDHEQLTIQRQSERLVALMEYLDLEKFAIAGHDQGSLRVWDIITKYPNKISHLIVMNSIAVRDGFHPPAGFGTENISTQFSSRAMGSRPLARIFAYGAMAGGLKDIKLANTTMINGYLFPLLNNMNNTYYDFITHFDEIETKISAYLELFPDLEIPTLIIWGAHDKILVGSEQIPVLAELLNVEDENIHLLDTAAHFIQEETPDEIVNLIDGFLNK